MTLASATSPGRPSRWRPRVVPCIVGVMSLPLLIAIALVGRPIRVWRRRRGVRPRVCWGPTPIANIIYWSRALERLGYQSTTFVREPYAINVRKDFDRLVPDHPWPGAWLAPLRPFVSAGWVLAKADTVSFFFNGGWMRDTCLEALELRILSLAGIRICVSPYGSDIALPGHLGPFETAMLSDYPMIETQAPFVRRRVDRFIRHADVVVRNFQVGYLPSWTVLWPSQIAIDTEQWKPIDEPGIPSRNGLDEAVLVVHASNHRAIKGTDDIIRAVEQLSADGLRITLELVERRPNAEVRDLLGRADVVVEQLIGGYGLFAIEAMASGRPVLSNLAWLPEMFRDHPVIRECPIRHTDAQTLTEDLRTLVTSPSVRQTMGAASREYAIAHHSLDAVGRQWAQLIDDAWFGRPPEIQVLDMPSTGNGT